MRSTKETAALEDMGYTLKARFIPWHRVPGVKAPRLHWRVTLLRNGSQIVTTRYFAGQAHCPSYPAAREVEIECSTGMRAGTNEIIRPDLADVMNCLLIDAACGRLTPEEFRRQFGDAVTHSEWKECRRIAEHFSARLGDAEIDRLHELFREF